ncbi:MAG: PP2C family protein-serine/threonine phosphatase [Acidobacteriaceae bacterium]
MIPAEQSHLNIAAASHPGAKGKQNEDRYSVLAYRFSPDEHTPSVIALLADGIGGHRAGEVAAELAVKYISQYVVDHSSGLPAQVLFQAFIHANQVILDHARQDPSMDGMGTTCVCAWVIGSQLYASSVGDSRLYLRRGAELLRLTTDHTWIQEALARGALAPDQVKGHPNAHIIRRYLGSTHALLPDMRLRFNPSDNDAQAEANQGLALVPGDQLVLCSDGLTDLLTDREIHEVLRTSQFKHVPTHLINLANLRGGHDNITVVALEVPKQSEITRPVMVKSPPVDYHPVKTPRTSASWLMILLLLLAIVMAASLLFYSLSH